ncbi:hypothetical protein MMC09_005606 [Bachmanniomyces sp. S44760]|nr:hypothetical protein [Bachmanniomyces sp. S44760]
MPSMKTSALVGAFACISQVAAHGVVSGIVAGGHFYQGYRPFFKYDNPQPVVVGWSIPEDGDTGYVPPSSFSNPDIICHKGATNAKTNVIVAAGQTVELQWTKWPTSHHGPVINYLANCNGDCTTVDKSKLLWNRLLSESAGLLDESKFTYADPGFWATDKLIAANNSWTLTIPSSIAAGNYVLRHEIIALHGAGKIGQAQNYPQCINLKITSSGSNSLQSGIVGTALYQAGDPGILSNIYQKLTSYPIPGFRAPSVGASGTASKGTTPPAAASSPSPASSMSGRPTPSPLTPAVTPADPAIVSFKEDKPANSSSAPSPAPADSGPPAGTTLQQLLDWTTQSIADFQKNGGKLASRKLRRSHAREILVE